MAPPAPSTATACPASVAAARTRSARARRCCPMTRSASRTPSARPASVAAAGTRSVRGTERPRNRLLHGVRPRRSAAAGAGSARGLERAPVLLWARPDQPSHVLAQRRGRAVADLRRDALDGVAARLEQLERAPDARDPHPARRRGTGLVAEAPAQAARAHRHATRQPIQRERLALVLLDPAEQRRERCAVVARYGTAGPLRLAAVALERHDGQLRRLHRDGGAVVAPYQVEAQVQARRGARRRQDLALVDVEDIRLDVDRRMAARELGGGTPVRRRTPAIQEARRG